MEGLELKKIRIGVSVLATLCMGSAAYAVNPIIGTVQLSTASIQQGGFNTLTGFVSTMTTRGEYCFKDGTCQSTAATGSVISQNGQVIASPQYRIPYYSLSGTTTTVAGNPGIYTDASNNLNVTAGISANQVSAANNITVTPGVGTQGYISIGANGAGNISVFTPMTVSGGYNLVLPATQGASNTVLTNDGFGTLSWAPAPGSSGNGVISPSDRYSVPYYSLPGSTNTVGGLLAGTSGYVLTTAGPTAPPYWAPQTGTGGGSGISALGINFNGVSITSPTAQINFVGSGVSVSATGSTATVTISGGGGSSSTPLETLFGTARSSPTATLRGSSDFLGSVSGSTMTVSMNPLNSSITTFASSVTVNGSGGLAVAGAGNGIVQLTINGSTYSVVSSSITPSVGSYLIWSSTNGTVGTGSGVSGSGGIVSPGTFTWTNNYGLSLSTVSVSGTSTLADVSEATTTISVAHGTTATNEALAIKETGNGGFSTNAGGVAFYLRNGSGSDVAYSKVVESGNTFSAGSEKGNLNFFVKNAGSFPATPQLSINAQGGVNQLDLGAPLRPASGSTITMFSPTLDFGTVNLAMSNSIGTGTVGWTGSQFSFGSTVSAPNLTLTSLPSQSCVGTDSSGNVQAGTCSGGASGSSITYVTTATNPAYKWVMNEGTGSTFANSATSGGSNNVLASGVTYYAQPQTTGFAASFDGTFSAAATSYANFNPDCTSPFSFSVWANWDQLGNSDVLMSQYLGSGGWWVLKNDGTGSRANELTMTQADANGKFAQTTFVTSIQAATVGRTPMVNIVGTFDGTHTAAGQNMYVNGVQVAVDSHTIDNITGSFTCQASTPIHLGSFNNTSASRHVGEMSGATVWNRVIASSEAVALYANGPSATTIQQPILPQKVVYASQIPGVSLDCSLSNGLTASGGTCTDNTAAINKILNTATSTSSVKLIMDGASATTGIVLPVNGHVTIEGIGWDSGFYVKAGSNKACISNGYASYPEGVIPQRGANVSLSNFKCNVNRGIFPNGNSTVTDARGYPNWISGIDLFGLDNVSIDHVWVYDTPTYAVNIGNVAHVYFTNSRLESPTTPSDGTTNTDGIHVNGPSEYVFMSNDWFHTQDDAIAFNAPESYGGAIQYVSINNVQMYDQASLVRSYQYYSGLNYGVTNMTVDGLVATWNGKWQAFQFFSPGGTPGSPADLSNSLKMSNISVTGGNSSGPLFDMNGEWGEVSLNNVSWIAPTSATAFLGLDATSSISSLITSHCKIYRNTVGNAAAYGFQIKSGATVKRLVLDDFAVENEYGQSYSAIGSLIDVPSGGAISSIYAPSMDMTNITSLLSSGSNARVASVAANNLFSGLTVAGPSSSTNVTLSTASAGITDFELSVSSQNAALLFGIQNNGHVVSSGTVPSVSSCGTSPTVDLNSTDFAGTINMGTGTPTACTLTFANAFGTTPNCTVSTDVDTFARISARSSTAITATLSTALGPAHLFYVCVGHQ